jgi:predicted NBD/HSP70 family sugar kinase
VPQDIADAAATAVRQAAAAIAEIPGAELARVVIAMAGPVGADQTVIAATDFGWLHEVRLGTLIAAALPDADCPLDVINDANAAALAEYHAHPRRPRGLVYIEAGTGIGGGVVLEGRIHTGSHGIAGEPGHMPVALDGPDCSCGARGCLVCYAGPEAVLTAAGLGDVLARDGLERALHRFDAAVHDADPAALAALEAAGRALGMAVLAINTLLDVDEVVLGGLLAQWFTHLRPAIDRALLRRRALAPAIELDVTAALLGEDAILLGVIEFARRAVFSDPATVPPLTADDETGPTG